MSKQIFHILLTSVFNVIYCIPMFVHRAIVEKTTEVEHFHFQLMHTTLKNKELLEHFKISKTALTCFGLQGNQKMLEQFY